MKPLFNSAINRICAAAVAALPLLAAQAFAGDAPKPAEADSLVAAVKSGKPIIDVRYRFEWKDQDGFADAGYANTVRTRLGVETGEIYNFKFLLEFENVASIGDDHFNSTANGRVQFPIIADPNATEINRAQVTFTGVEKTPITIGRQAFNLLDQRFVGAVDFRQNQQTFDAARVSSTIIDRLTVDYLYVSRVHRVFGDNNALGEFDSDSHIVAATYDAGDAGKISAYGLLLDFEESPALSSNTFGVRYENSFSLGRDTGARVGIIGEYAAQHDAAGNPFDYSEGFLHGEGAFTVGGAGLKLGYERLGGDGVIGFSTPLATLHKFQGFADVFLTTPTNGIEDIYGTAQYNLKKGPFGAGFNVFATFHDFKTANGGADLGEEFDAGVGITFRKYWTAEIKGAVYDGVPGLADRSLVWASVRFQY